MATSLKKAATKVAKAKNDASSREEKGARELTVKATAKKAARKVTGGR